MDPSLYQQQRQQQNRVPYPFTGNPQAGLANVMGAGTYPQQYMTNITNSAGYIQSNTGINPMMPIPGRPVYPVPVASLTSMTTNGMPAAKRVALAPTPPMQSIFSNIAQTPGQNQLYTAGGGFPNQQMISPGRPTVPAQSFVNTDNQNMDGKSSTSMHTNAYAASIQSIDKHYGQFQQQTPPKANTMGNNFNNLLNQTQTTHPQQQNQTISNPFMQDDSQTNWLEFDDDDIVYDFSYPTEFNSSSGMGGNIHGWSSNPLQSNLNYSSQNSSKSYSSINQSSLQRSPQQQQHDNQVQQQQMAERPQPRQTPQHQQSQTIQISSQTHQHQQQPSHREDTGFSFSTHPSLSVQSSSITQNLSPKNVQHNTMRMLPRSPNPAIPDSNPQSSIYGNQSQPVNSTNLSQTQATAQIGQFSKINSKEHLVSNTTITGFPQSSTQSTISTELSSSTSIHNTVLDPYKQSPQTTNDTTSLTSMKPNSLIGHLDSMQRITSQENTNDSSILPTIENQNSYTSNIQMAVESRNSSSTSPKNINNLSESTNFSRHHQNSQTSNTELLTQSTNNNKQHTSNPNVTDDMSQNLRLPVSSGIAGRRAVTSRQIPRQSEKAPVVTHPTPTTSTQSSNSTLPTQTSKQGPVKPQKVNYAPKTRRVDSYGGLDLRVFEKFSLPLNIPGIQDLGTVDVHALTMSLKCGMKLEVTSALNTLTTLSCYKNLIIDLKQCGDLVDILLDMILEYIDSVSPSCNEETTEESLISPRKFITYQKLYQLSRQECDEFADVAMDNSNIVNEWLSLHEQCWCITNLIRNFSFMFENQECLATHPKLLTVLMCVLYIGEDDDFLLDVNEKVKADRDIKDNRTRITRKKAYDILELRKSVIIILSNIAAYLTLPSIYVARDLLVVIADLLDNTDDYYAQVALEVFAKISVSYENRQRIGGCDESTLTTVLERLVRMLPQGENSIGYAIGNGVITRPSMQELPYLAMLVMSFFNFACLSGEVMRKKMVSTPGFINRMLKMSITLASVRDNRIGNNDDDCIMLARRTMEMLKILAKGNEECFLIYTEQLLFALLTPYIDPIVVKDLETVIYPGDI
ncbi:SWI/SNF chromatin-remodeling complex subunit SWI1 [Gigaspora margarita]|uniref:SWI/SNF chromatin-remodeling complex subunit SWI1 n=1 Tax=Gigaspora margarita TaxID=4874 RepID=A0A8H3X3G8_GIGMA|nr:SWI/SNF chromatin-remodeling complex subunit SWI1 [Gigaspora margarita]